MTEPAFPGLLGVHKRYTHPKATVVIFFETDRDKYMFDTVSLLTQRIPYNASTNHNPLFDKYSKLFNAPAPNSSIQPAKQNSSLPSTHSNIAPSLPDSTAPTDLISTSDGFDFTHFTSMCTNQLLLADSFSPHIVTSPLYKSIQTGKHTIKSEIGIDVTFDDDVLYDVMIPTQIPSSHLPHYFSTFSTQVTQSQSSFPYTLNNISDLKYIPRQSQLHHNPPPHIPSTALSILPSHISPQPSPTTIHQINIDYKTIAAKSIISQLLGAYPLSYLQSKMHTVVESAPFSQAPGLLPGTNAASQANEARINRTNCHHQASSVSSSSDPPEDVPFYQSNDNGESNDETSEISPDNPFKPLLAMKKQYDLRKAEQLRGSQLGAKSNPRLKPLLNVDVQLAEENKFEDATHFTTPHQAHHQHSQSFASLQNDKNSLPKHPKSYFPDPFKNLRHLVFSNSPDLVNHINLTSNPIHKPAPTQLQESQTNSRNQSPATTTESPPLLELPNTYLSLKENTAGLTHGNMYPFEIMHVLTMLLRNEATMHHDQSSALLHSQQLLLQLFQTQLLGLVYSAFDISMESNQPAQPEKKKDKTASNSADGSATKKQFEFSVTIPDSHFLAGNNKSADDDGAANTPNVLVLHINLQKHAVQHILAANLPQSDSTPPNNPTTTTVSDTFIDTLLNHIVAICRNFYSPQALLDSTQAVEYEHMLEFYSSFLPLSSTKTPQHRVTFDQLSNHDKDAVRFVEKYHVLPPGIFKPHFQTDKLLPRFTQTDISHIAQQIFNQTNTSLQILTTSTTPPFSPPSRHHIITSIPNKSTSHLFHQLYHNNTIKPRLATVDHFFSIKSAKFAPSSSTSTSPSPSSSETTIPEHITSSASGDRKIQWFNQYLDQLMTIITQSKFHRKDFVYLSILNNLLLPEYALPPQCASSTAAAEAPSINSQPPYPITSYDPLGANVPIPKLINSQSLFTSIESRIKSKTFSVKTLSDKILTSSTTTAPANTSEDAIQLFTFGGEKTDASQFISDNLHISSQREPSPMHIPVLLPSNLSTQYPPSQSQQTTQNHSSAASTCPNSTLSANTAVSNFSSATPIYNPNLTQERPILFTPAPQHDTSVHINLPSQSCDFIQGIKVHPRNSLFHHAEVSIPLQYHPRILNSSAPPPPSSPITTSQLFHHLTTQQTIYRQNHHLSSLASLHTNSNLYSGPSALASTPSTPIVLQPQQVLPYLQPHQHMSVLLSSAFHPNSVRPGLQYSEIHRLREETLYNLHHKEEWMNLVAQQEQIRDREQADNSNDAKVQEPNSSGFTATGKRRILHTSDATATSEVPKMHITVHSARQLGLLQGSTVDGTQNVQIGVAVDERPHQAPTSTDTSASSTETPQQESTLTTSQKLPIYSPTFHQQVVFQNGIILISDGAINIHQLLPHISYKIGQAAKYGA